MYKTKDVYDMIYNFLDNNRITEVDDLKSIYQTLQECMLTIIDEYEELGDYN